MDRSAFLEVCGEFLGVGMDAPFEGDESTLVARHLHNRKWFALVFTLDGRDCVNLKCDPIQAQIWRGAFEGVSPAWHMNKAHWNMVAFNSDVPDEIIRDMAYASYKLTAR